MRHQRQAYVHKSHASVAFLCSDRPSLGLGMAAAGRPYPGTRTRNVTAYDIVMSMEHLFNKNSQFQFNNRLYLSSSVEFVSNRINVSW